jgi:hypothetical protein
MADTTPDRVHASAYGCITIPFLLIACVPLLWGARNSWIDGRLERDGVVANGRVVGLRHVPRNPSISSFESGPKSRNAESPVVMFTLRGGEVRTMVGSVNRSPAPWKVGDVVEVVYDAADPARADLRSELTGWRRWFGIWCAVAILPLFIAVLPLVLRFYNSRGRLLV